MDGYSLVSSHDHPGSLYIILSVNSACKAGLHSFCCAHLHYSAT